MRFNYNDLIVKIELYEEQIKSMEKEREFLRRSMYDNSPKFKGVVNYEGERVTGGIVPLSLDVIIKRLNKIDDSLDMLYRLLNEMKDSKKRIESMMSELEGLEYKVAYMRDVQRMRLQEIADKLGYSHEHIRRISSRIKKLKHG